jgi:hypothetical protein
VGFLLSYLRGIGKATPTHKYSENVQCPENYAILLSMQIKQITRIGIWVVMGLSSILAGCDLWSKEPEMYQGQRVYSAKDVSKIPFSLKEQGASLDVLANSGPDGNANLIIFALFYWGRNWI